MMEKKFDLEEYISDVVNDKIYNSPKFSKYIEDKIKQCFLQDGKNSFNIFEEENTRLKKELQDLNSLVKKYEIELAKEKNKNSNLENEILEKNISLQKIHKIEEERKKERAEFEIIQKNYSVSEENLKNEIAKSFEIEKSLKEYKKLFQTIYMRYEDFLNIPENIKNNIKNTFPSENIYSFIYSIGDEENINITYEYLRSNIIENPQNTDMNYIKEIVKLMIDIANSKYESPKYELIMPEKDEEYDRDYHIIIGRKTCGNVKSTVLFGYKIKNEVVYKALIFV